ncbi:MAG: hypothetical protein R3F14_17435 [Polyangiaceae bacterium]
MLVVCARLSAVVAFVAALLFSSAALAAPPVTPEFGMDNPVPVSGIASPVARWDLAWNGSVLLAVWDETGTQGLDVYGMRLTAAGVPIGSRFLIAGGVNDQKFPAVASDGADFMVVWVAPSGGSSGIWASRVSGAGAVLDPGGILISTGDLRADIVFGGGNYLIGVANGTVVRGIRVDPAGTLLGSPIVVSSTPAGSSASSPNMAFNGTSYLLAWSQTTGGQGDLYARRLSAAGAVLDAAPIAVNTFATSHYVRSVASNGTDFFVLATAVVGNEVVGVRVSGAGAALDPAPISIGTASGAPQMSVEYDGANYVAAWGTGDSFVRRVSSAGALVDASPVVVSNAVSSQKEPVLARTGTNLFALWGDDRNLIGTELWGARIAPGLSVLDPNGVQVTSNSIVVANAQHTPAVATNGSIYLAVWRDLRSGSDEIWGTRISAQGQILDPNGILIGQGKTPAVTSDGVDFMVAWTKPSGTGNDIRTTRVTAAGTVVTPGGVPHAAPPGEVPWEITAASDGTNFLIVFSTSNVFSPSNEVFTMRIDAAMQQIGFTSGVNVTSARDPNVGFDGTNYLVVWGEQSGAGPSTSDLIYARHMSPSWAWVEPGPLIVTPDGQTSFNASIAFDGTNALIAFERNFTGDIYAVGVSPSNQLLGAPFPICTATNAQQSPSVSFDGTDFIVSWQDLRSGSDRDVYAARVTTAAQVLDPGGFLVSGALNEDEETVGSAAIGSQVIVVYRRNDKTPGVQSYRARARLIGVAGGGACASPADCPSGFCVDGVCCNSACGGGDMTDCQACSVSAGAASDGICGPVDFGILCRAAVDECDADEVCDGLMLSCPVDMTLPDGAPCSGGACLAGVCEMGGTTSTGVGGGGGMGGFGGMGDSAGWGSRWNDRHRRDGRIRRDGVLVEQLVELQQHGSWRMGRDGRDGVLVEQLVELQQQHRSWRDGRNGLFFQLQLQQHRSWRDGRHGFVIEQLVELQQQHRVGGMEWALLPAPAPAAPELAGWAAWVRHRAARRAPAAAPELAGWAPPAAAPESAVRARQAEPAASRAAAARSAGPAAPARAAASADSAGLAGKAEQAAKVGAISPSSAARAARRAARGMGAISRGSP